MDTVKTGRFISQLRRDRGLTQQELGELVSATNKTVSRWETGSYMPPIEVLELLSKEFGVTINEIVAGEKLTPERFAEAAEENLSAALSEPGAFGLSERISFFKRKWLHDHAFEIAAIVILLIAAGIGMWFLVKELCPAVCALLGIFEYCYLNNRMMTYVEQKAFGGEKK